MFSVFPHDHPYYGTFKEQTKMAFKAPCCTVHSFHGLCHTHATIMLNAGIQPKDLQYRLEHSNISMTLNTYVHVTKEGAKNSASFFEYAINAFGE